MLLRQILLGTQRVNHRGLLYHYHNPYSDPIVPLVLYGVTTHLLGLDTYIVTNTEVSEELIPSPDIVITETARTV